MRGTWQAVYHQPAWDFAESLTKRERHRLNDAIGEIRSQPFAEADSEIETVNERTVFLRVVKNFQVHYWLDVFVKQVVIVRLDRD